MSLATVFEALERMEEVSIPSTLTFVERFKHGIAASLALALAPAPTLLLDTPNAWIKRWSFWAPEIVTKKSDSLGIFSLNPLVFS